MAKAKEILLGKMCFAGNIDPSEDIASRGCSGCGRYVQVGTDGGFVLMPGCDITPTVPYENIRKFVQVARDWKG